MQIEFSAKDKPQEWFKTIARQFGTTIINDTIEIPASVGEGIFKQIYFFEGLTLTYLQVRLIEPLNLLGIQFQMQNSYLLCFTVRIFLLNKPSMNRKK